MSLYEDDGPAVGEDDTELDLSGLDDDEPLHLDDDGDFDDDE